MPNATRPPSITPTTPLDPEVILQRNADALFRSALECLRQRDRAARLTASDEPQLEHQHVVAICVICDQSLSELAEAYASVATKLTAPSAEPWRQKAHGLWQASREYVRRHASCDALDKRVSAKHSAENLAGMKMEYEFEASALLALRHAADAYKKARPGLA